MPVELWTAAEKEVDQLINILATERQYSVEEVTIDYDELAERTPAQEKDSIVRIRGSIISFIDRLDDEFTKSLQNLDPHGTEYVERLRDEKGLYETICLSQGFYEATSQSDPLSRVILRRLDHIYSKVSISSFSAMRTFDQSQLVAGCCRASSRSVYFSICFSSVGFVGVFWLEQGSHPGTVCASVQVGERYSQDTVYALPHLSSRVA